jgi:all-trans-retinol 13,14-reductase
MTLDMYHPVSEQQQQFDLLNTTTKHCLLSSHGQNAATSSSSSAALSPSLLNEANIRIPISTTSCGNALALALESSGEIGCRPKHRQRFTYRLSRCWLFQALLLISMAGLSHFTFQIMTSTHAWSPKATLRSIRIHRQNSCASFMYPCNYVNSRSQPSFPSQSLSLLAAKATNRDDGIDDHIYDTIVIGSGIGGLTAASLLVQCDESTLAPKDKARSPNQPQPQQPTPPYHKVLVLEQHDRLGGCCHVFERQGYEFATGIHYVGQMGNATDATTTTLEVLPCRDMLHALMPQQAPVQWHSWSQPGKVPMETLLLGNLHDRSLERHDIYPGMPLTNATHPSLQRRYEELIHKAVRAGRRAFAFKALPRRLVRFLLHTGWHTWWDQGYSKYAAWTVQSVIDQQLIPRRPFWRRGKRKEDGLDNSTQALISYLWGDYGTTPREASWVMHALVSHHYHSQGAYYPIGGPSQIPYRIAQVIQARGGRLQTQAGVQQILVRQGRAVGVQLYNGTKYYARNIVSNAGYLNTYKYLVPPVYQPRDMLSADSFTLRNGPTGMSLFVGLRGDYQSWKIPPQQLWMYPTHVPMKDLMQAYPATLEQALQNSDQLADCLAPVFVGCPSAKDPTWSTRYPHRTTLEIITAIPWEWFQEWTAASGDINPAGPPGNRRPNKSYQTNKDRLAQVLWSRARQALIQVGASLKLPVQLSDADFYEVGTPLTWQSYLWSHQGSFYGLDHDTSRWNPHEFYLTLRPEQNQLPGLYLTGQDIASCGMAGAMAAGYLCAAQIAGVRNPLHLLQRVDKYRVVRDPAVWSAFSLLDKEEAVYQGESI